MPSAFNVIKEQGPRFLRELYDENVVPTRQFLSDYAAPADLAELATVGSKVMGYGAIPAALLYSAESAADSDIPGAGLRPRHKDFSPSPIGLSDVVAARSQYEAAKVRQAMQKRAYDRAFEELMAKYPPPSVVITDPELNARRAKAQDELFADKSALAEMIAKRATKYMEPQGYAGGGVVKRIYRGIRAPAIDRSSPLEQLVGVRMTEPASNKMINTMAGATWWTDNPRVANTYIWRHGGSTSVLVPADMIQAPDVTLDAAGAFWNDYYTKGAGAKAFKKAMRDPDVKTVMVRDIVDPGGQVWDYLPEMKELYGDMGIQDMLREHFRADNVLVKDPSMLRYLSGEEAKYACGGKVRRK